MGEFFPNSVIISSLVNAKNSLIMEEIDMQLSTSIGKYKQSQVSIGPEQQCGRLFCMQAMRPSALTSGYFS